LNCGKNKPAVKTANVSKSAGGELPEQICHKTQLRAQPKAKLRLSGVKLNLSNNDSEADTPMQEQ